LNLEKYPSPPGFDVVDPASVHAQTFKLGNFRWKPSCPMERTLLRRGPYWEVSWLNKDVLNLNLQ
jgi:hypothetical protein